MKIPKAGYARIRQGMREREQWVLNHFRTHRVGGLLLWSNASYQALDRLQAAGMVKYDRKAMIYRVRKYARPVTQTPIS